MKLKDLLLENPKDYVDGNIDTVDLIRRKSKYQDKGIGPSESHHDRKEGKMAKYDAKEIAEDAVAVFKMIDKDMDLPEWLEAKITKSADYMNSVKDYLTHHMKSDDSDNENQSQNEDMSGTSKVMKSVRKGPTSGPWNLIVSKNNKVVKQVSVKNLKEIPAELADLRKKYSNHRIGIEAKDGKIVYREGTCGYGVDGELGDEPAGPHLLKKKSKTEQVINAIKENTCVNCGNIVNEDLRNWFKSKWVNIGKKDKSGKHPACGTSGDKRGYAKCVPASKAASMSKKEKESATRRKRAAQNKAGRGGKKIKGQGRKPVNVSTHTKGKKSGTGKGS